EQYEIRLAETERARALAEAEARALREQGMAGYTSPEVAAKYAELREAWGEEEAQRYRRGVMAEQERSRDEGRQQGEQQSREQAAPRRGEQLMARAEQAAMQR